MKKILLVLLIFYSYGFSNQLPDLGSTSDNIINKFQEKKIRHELLSQVYASPSVIKDPEVIDYINRLGEKLVRVNPELNIEDITFFTVKDPTINAFAMLGGIIGIHTGLLYAANSESELASVLAHEIAHISQKHLPRIIEAQSKDTFKTSLAMVFALLVARSNAQLANAAMQTAVASAVQNTLDFTREHEKEADREGLLMLNKAGFDERAAISFFKTLDKANQFTVGAAPSFLRTHPVTLDRISDIENRLKEFPYKQVSEDPTFNLIQAKLKAYSGEPTNNISIFENNLTDKGYLSDSSMNFALSYAYLRNNQIAKSRDYFNKVLYLKNTSPLITELGAKILVKERKLEQAENLYKESLLYFPNYKAYIYGLTDIYINMNDLNKAINFVKQKLLVYPRDYNLYMFLAKIYAKKDARYLEHKNLSEYFYFRFDLKESANQVSLAINASDADFYNKSSAEQRLKEIQSELYLYDSIK